MTGGVKDLLASERGAWCLALALVALGLVLIKILTGSEWVTFMQWVTTILVASKTVSGVSRDRAVTAPSNPTTPS